MIASATPLFVYGTLRDADILASVLGRAISAQGLPPAEAPGFAAVYSSGRTYPSLIPRQGASAPGALLCGMSQADQALLDAFEGDEYRLAPITVSSAGLAVRALFYRPTMPIAPNAEDWTLSAWQCRHKKTMLAEHPAAHTRR